MVLQSSSRIMAEFAVTAASPVVKMVVEKLASGLWEQLGLARSVHTDFEKLQSMLSRIKAVLNVAERRSINDEAVFDWLKKLRDAAFDADDVVDEFQTEALRRRIERRDHMTGKVRDFFSSNNPIAFRYKMARKIREIRERFDEIAKENKDFDGIVKSESDRPVNRETKSLAVESEIYGRDTEKNEVIQILVDKDNDKNISVLPIVGLGGIGKTTLAQTVYHNDRIEQHFELRMWVCVGENFDEEVVLQKMTVQVPGEPKNSSILETKSSFLKEELRTKRFLLVLDDLWNEDELEWEKLKPLFEHAKLGSKIIVTTRSERVASIAGTIVPPCRLQGLGIDCCWTLFKQRAFRSETEEDNPELVEIGRKIIKKCGGLPLAAKVLGSLMNSYTKVHEWSAICKDFEAGGLPIGEDGILHVLKLSYDHLPSHLKRCFTYCSVFPKDHIFEMTRLIQLWMAEGLIDTSRTSQNAEDIGKQYFDNLLSRSFFQDVQMDEFINLVTCKMHDLVHDLACSITKDEALVMQGGKKSISLVECRYLSVPYSSGSSIDFKTTYEAKKLRSLIFLGAKYHSNVDVDEFIFNATKTFTQLRALGLNSHGFAKLSNRINKLKHLRFLDLSFAPFTTLPASITRLYNLQTLNLFHCRMLKELPEGIGNLCNLRYMDISWCHQITTLPASITRLYNLQTLNLRACHMLEELPDGIGNLCNLRYMNISSCIKITTLPTSITRLSSLQTLNLSYCRMLRELPEGIGNLCNLRYMDISRCPKITTLPTSITRLSSLQTLNLEECGKLEELPEGIGNLCNLRYMDISWCDKITMLPTSITRLSSLQTLNLKDCRMLEELPEGIGNLCNLRYMDISWCCEILTTLPTSITRLSSLQTLNLSYCRMLKELPEGIANLCNLRHLDMTECYHLACIPRGLGRLSNLETLTMFIVAQENGRTIAELQHLNSIRGSLEIKNLHHVKDPDEAMQANLRAKTRLNRLSLGWNRIHEPSSTEVEVAEGVFERLQPHHNLEKLEIYSYIGTRLPNWMSPSFPNLVELTMGNLERCEHLPLGPWPSLKSLRLYSMHAMRRIREEFYGDGGGITFPSLENLTLANMPSLEKWHAESCPCLTELEIISCPKLVVQPCIPCSVEIFLIKSSNEMLLSAGSLRHLTALESLYIFDLPQLKMLPDGLRYLTALQKLHISNLPQLKMLLDGLRHLTALRQLNLSNLPQLAMLPDGLQHLTALQYLRIEDCPQLVRRCKRETGEDRHKIAHIPHISIWPSIREEEDRREEENREEMNERRTFAAKFLAFVHWLFSCI